MFIGIIFDATSIVTTGVVTAVIASASASIPPVLNFVLPVVNQMLFVSFRNIVLPTKIKNFVGVDWKMLLQKPS